MRKVLFVTSFFLLFFAAASNVEASLLVIDRQGAVVWNVLAQESSSIEIPKTSGLSVKEIVNTKPPEDAKVILKKDGEKISLVVSGENGNKELDVSGWRDDLVEIEERPEIQTVKIGIDEGRFSLEQKGIVALTDFPINIDAKSAKISASTEGGERYISILPAGAVESLTRAGLISKLGQEIYLTEQGNELAYKVSGEKVINFFNIFSFSIPVTARVSASTGQLLLIEEPKWFKVLNFLFV